MSKELIEALTELANKFGMAIDWTSQNAMPYLQELMNRIIHFEMVTSICWLIYGILHFLTVILWMKAIRYAGKKIEEDEWSDWEFNRRILVVGMVVTVFLGFIIASVQIDDILRCIMLPESIVLRYIKEAQ